VRTRAVLDFFRRRWGRFVTTASRDSHGVNVATVK
jgi:hypothetical protein